MVSWFKREFGQPEQRMANELGIEVEELFDELVNTVPPGSLGLTLQPFWSPGLRVPGPEAKGAVIGFGDVHTRAHLYRSILEGLAYALREGAERTARRSGVPITEIRVAGGGSQSAPPCSSPPISLAFPPPARTCTRHLAWARPSMPRLGWACTPTSRPPSPR
jgi:sugar (pentulose or hexulose) kinase